MSLAYVLTGKSLAYSYVLHVFNNAVALILSYTLLPLFPAVDTRPSARRKSQHVSTVPGKIQRPGTATSTAAAATAG